MAPFAMERIVLGVDGKLDHNRGEIVAETSYVSGTERTVRLNVDLFQERKSKLLMRGLTLAGANEEAFLGQTSGQAQMKDLMYEVVWKKDEGVEKKKEKGKKEGDAEAKILVVGSKEEVVEKVWKDVKEHSGEGQEVEKLVLPLSGWKKEEI